MGISWANIMQLPSPLVQLSLQTGDETLAFLKRDLAISAPGVVDLRHDPALYAPVLDVMKPKGQVPRVHDRQPGGDMLFANGRWSTQVVCQADLYRVGCPKDATSLGHVPINGLSVPGSIVQPYLNSRLLNASASSGHSLMEVPLKLRIVT